MVTTITLENRALPHRTTATTRCLLLPVLTHPSTHPSPKGSLPPSLLPSWQKPETSFIPRNKLIYEFLLELFFLIFYHPFSFRLKNSSQFWKYLRLLRLENFDSNDDLATKVFEFLRVSFASIFQSRKQILTAEDRLTRRTT